VAVAGRVNCGITENWTHIDYLARLVAIQATADRDRRLAARMRYARFPFHRRIEDFDFDFQPSIDRKLVEDLATLRFIDEHRPILLLGQPGCGKTHLAVALAIVAVEAGYRGYFSTADAMVKTMVRADHDGVAATKIKTYTAQGFPWNRGGFLIGGCSLACGGVMTPVVEAEVHAA
jgi:DNA replication protein DnaC